MGHSEFDPAAKERRPWNAGRMVGAKRALRPRRGHGIVVAHQLLDLGVEGLCVSVVLADLRPS